MGFLGCFGGGKKTNAEYAKAEVAGDTEVTANAKGAKVRKGFGRDDSSCGRKEWF
jgi:hypothetical protein